MRQLILAALHKLADKDGWAVSSYRNLADEAGVSVGTVKRHLDHLEADGLIVKRKRYWIDGGIDPNGYLVVPLAPADRDPAELIEAKLDAEFDSQFMDVAAQEFGLLADQPMDRKTWFTEVLPRITGAKTSTYFSEDM